MVILWVTLTEEQQAVPKYVEKKRRANASKNYVNIDTLMSA